MLPDLKLSRKSLLLLRKRRRLKSLLRLPMLNPHRLKLPPRKLLNALLLKREITSLVKNVVEAEVAEVVVVTIEVDVAARDVMDKTVELMRPKMVSTLPPTNVPRTSVAAAVDAEVTTATEPKEVKAVTSEEAVTEEVAEEAAPKVSPPRRTTLNLKPLKLIEEHLTYEQATLAT